MFALQKMLWFLVLPPASILILGGAGLCLIWKGRSLGKPLAGSTDLTWIGARPEPNAETFSRLVAGVEMARRLGAPLVLSMGNGEPFSTTVSDADTMAEAAVDMGMPRERIIVENRSRDTVENSFEVRRIVKGDRIVLVTSAYHMKRAAAMFRRRGFIVVPAPAYFLSQTRRFSPFSLIPRAGAFTRSTVGIAEWISLGWWRLRGEM
jgi:uncharacterized SAM-binding protein YcdF (DUF218 family)